MIGSGVTIGKGTCDPGFHYHEEYGYWRELRALIRPSLRRTASVGDGAVLGVGEDIPNKMKP